MLCCCCAKGGCVDVGRFGGIGGAGEAEDCGLLPSGIGGPYDCWCCGPGGAHCCWCCSC